MGLMSINLPQQLNVISQNECQWESGLRPKSHSWERGWGGQEDSPVQVLCLREDQHFCSSLSEKQRSCVTVSLFIQPSTWELVLAYLAQWYLYTFYPWNLPVRWMIGQNCPGKVPWYWCLWDFRWNFVARWLILRSKSDHHYHQY